MTKTKRKTLTLRTLGQLHDGLYGHQVNKHLAEAIQDCDERPGLSGARTVTIKITLTPDQEASGHGSDMVVVAESNVSLPKVKTRKERLNVTRDEDGTPALIVPDVQPNLLLNQLDEGSDA